MALLSFFDISLETANKFYSWGWKASLFGAIITLIGVSLLMWGTRVRDHDFECNMSKLNTDAANTNKRAQEIEHNNLRLRTDLEQSIIESVTEKQKLAQIQIEVANARRKQAEAEKALEELRVAAKKAARGITSLYGFRGEKRDTSAGVSATIIGEETLVFEKLVTLEKAGNFPELISLCKEQIVKTPTWLTPHLFLGIAQSNMGFKNEAILNLEHVIKNAPGDPDYQHAADILKQLKNK